MAAWTTLDYPPSPVSEAGTARVRAHSRNARISSARVTESGTVCVKTSSNSGVVSGCFCEKAA